MLVTTKNYKSILSELNISMNITKEEFNTALGNTSSVMYITLTSKSGEVAELRYTGSSNLERKSLNKNAFRTFGVRKSFKSDEAKIAHALNMELHYFEQSYKS